MSLIKAYIRIACLLASTLSGLDNVGAVNFSYFMPTIKSFILFFFSPLLLVSRVKGEQPDNHKFFTLIMQNKFECPFS